jgi:signal transduction histidine kinase
MGDAQAALGELRELAHGIYPAILTEAGLGPALWTLAEDARLPIEIGEVPDERFSEAVERAAYLVVSGAIETASGHVTAIVRREDRRLVTSVEGVEPPAPIQLADRVGALGGRISSEDGVLRAEIPCG